MNGLTAPPSTSSGRTVKAFCLSRLKWIAEIREHRKTIKRHQEQIAEIKSQFIALQQAAEDKKKHLAPTKGQIVEITQAQEVRTVCVLMVIQAVVSYRSIPIILNLLNSETAPTILIMTKT